VVKRSKLSISELSAAIQSRIAARLSELELFIDVGVSGETRNSHAWLASRSTRPGEVYRVTTFYNDVPVGHIVFTELRDVAVHLCGISST
jgi:hypothetical protein